MCAKLPYAPSTLSVSVMVIMQNAQEKANLQNTKVTPQNKKKFVRTETNFILGAIHPVV